LLAIVPIIVLVLVLVRILFRVLVLSIALFPDDKQLLVRHVKRD